jgi:hypothetical protein
MNPDRALLRFEFVDAIIRMANRKYVMVRRGLAGLPRLQSRVPTHPEPVCCQTYRFSPPTASLLYESTYRLGR